MKTDRTMAVAYTALMAVLVNVLMKHAPALFKIRGEAR